MTLRRLGIPIRDQLAQVQRENSDRNILFSLLRRISDYFALMTDEPDPPTETTLTDE